MTQSSAPSLGGSGRTAGAKNVIWNDDRRQRLEELWQRGLSAYEIAAILSDSMVKISENAVQVQASRMSLSARFKSDTPDAVNGPAAMRRCMRCTRLFMSEGKHNRICDPCKSSEDWNDDSPFFLIASPRSARKRDDQ
jgi:Uncharacterized protein conserved in bacteria